LPNNSTAEASRGRASGTSSEGWRGQTIVLPNVNRNQLYCKCLWLNWSGQKFGISIAVISQRPINLGRRSNQNSTSQNSLAVKSSDHSWLLRRYMDGNKCATDLLGWLRWSVALPRRAGRATLQRSHVPLFMSVNIFPLFRGRVRQTVSPHDPPPCPAIAPSATEEVPPPLWNGNPTESRISHKILSPLFYGNMAKSEF